MNSFKKISAILAALVAFGTMSAISANAADMTLSVKVGAATAGSNATTATAPASVTVPADNEIEEADTVRLIATVDTGTTVTFTATGPVRLVSALDDASGTRVRPSNGVTSLTVPVGTGTTATVYAFNTSTTAGSVTISNLGVTNTVYVKGTTGAANNVTLTGPSSASAGTVATYIATVTDVFGNLVSGETVTATIAGGVVNGTTSTITSTLTTGATGSTVGLGLAELKVLTPASGSTTVIVAITAATAVSGLTAPNGSTTATTVVSNPANEIASLNAIIASLNSQLAAEKAGRAADVAKAKSDADSVKLASDKALADAKVAADAKYAKLLKAYNDKAKKHKFATKK
ncbi:hypothetical protein UFOVP1119_26 [uncultured Caudovirales phage]|uniref:Uncharacterized protein n=1 Tax=uncultured Caudovirales phage TaxID=2100421 RepID=A0A6J5RJJ5_9CAUD|nr:hypothetical protein UFOVP1119_26 [uncultured Caudovirales phage]CAB4193761.1 hypothetical protein UFOVP1238_143 [uncultured Caudovirales phage]